MSEFRRRLMMGMSGGALPYDAEIEYLRSHNGAYIDSGIECTADLSVEFSGMVFQSINAACCGAIESLGSGTYSRHHWSPYQTNFYWLQRNGTNMSSIRLQTSAYQNNRWYNVSIDAVNGTAIIDGRTIKFSPISESISMGSNYGIFARLGMFQARDSAFKFFKIKRAGVLLRDYISVRRGLDGYLYDKVSGRMFGNNGDGYFDIGNDVNI